MARKVSRGLRNIRWIEDMIIVPEGMFVGEKLRLMPFQKRFLRSVYNNPAHTRQAILSIGRKNGKTTLAAALLLLHLCGPEAHRNSQLYSTAQALEQSSILYGLASKMVRMSPYLNEFLDLQDSVYKIQCKELGTVYAALSSEPKTKHGLSPIFCVHDELGQVEGGKSKLYDTMESGMSAHKNQLSIIISTQAPTDADMLSQKIDLALTGANPRLVVQLHSADMSLNPFSMKALRAANPALDDYVNREEILNSRKNAIDMPAAESSYRNLVLNQRVDASTPFITHSVWAANGGPVGEMGKHKVYGGLDLSATQDLTALVWVWWDDKGKWNVKPTFWLPAVGLIQKSRRDRVPYDIWHRQGFLEVTPGKAIDYDFIAQHIKDCFDTMDIQTIAFDRWQFPFLAKNLERVGFPDWSLEGDEAKFTKFGQGYISMSPALRTLESDLVENRLRHGMHPVLTMCAANAVVEIDAAENRKLTKKIARGRIDGMVALAMARAVAEKDEVLHNLDAEIWYG